ncbi:MAG: peptidoglycan editing factor PgeF [Anaerolineae bacterium]|jgi:YfiH family protein|nr:peptidoglycan editing factor PgeF [Chloroflexota bacterium]
MARVLLYQFETFQRPGLLHAVTTSCGGHSRGGIQGLNLGRTTGDDPASVEANHRALYERLLIAPSQVVSASQVHGAHVARVTAADGGAVMPETDGLISDTPGLALLMRFADCVPVLLYDARRRAVGLAHAGWRGALAGVATNTVIAMQRAYGCSPDDLQAGLGPSIGPCCFEVGPEVVQQVRETCADSNRLITRQQPNGHAWLNLWGLVEAQLRALGLKHIESARLCTACRHDLFYSYRRQGAASGRLAAVIGLQAIDV